MPRALRNAVAFKKMSGTTWRGMARRRVWRCAARRNLKWSQLALAGQHADASCRAGLVEGRLDAGVLFERAGRGCDRGICRPSPSSWPAIMNEAEQTLKRLGESSRESHAQIRRPGGAPSTNTDDRGPEGRRPHEGKTRVPAAEGWFTMDEGRAPN